MAAPLNQPGRQATVLLTGATGQVGIFALPRLLAAGYKVIAISRRITASPGGVSETLRSRRRLADPGWVSERSELDQKGRAHNSMQSSAAAFRRRREQGSETPNLRWFHPDAVHGMSGRNGAKETGNILQDIGILLSCGPVELAARWAPLCPQLRRVVCISTSSVYTKLASPDAVERRLIAGIKASEDALKRCCAARGISLVLLRPTLIYGCGLDQNVSRIARLVRRFHFMPLAGKASGRRQPVHADDLAKLTLNVLEARDLPGIECAVGGGSVISYRELVERIFAGIGLTPRILQIPPQVLAMLVRAVSWLPLMGGLNAEFIFRQNLDLVFDDTWLRDQLDFAPRPFEPTAEDFKVPEYARALQPR